MPSVVSVFEVLHSAGLACHSPNVGFGPEIMALFRTTGNGDCTQSISVSTSGSPWTHKGVHHPIPMFLYFPGDVSGVLVSKFAPSSQPIHRLEGVHVMQSDE